MCVYINTIVYIYTHIYYTHVLLSQTQHICSRVAVQSFSDVVGSLRLSVYGGGLLTLVAFKYGVMDHLPSVPYPTFTDNFLPLGPSWTAWGRKLMAEGRPGVFVVNQQLHQLHFYCSRAPLIVLIVQLFWGTLRVERHLARVSHVRTCHRPLDHRLPAFVILKGCGRSWPSFSRPLHLWFCGDCTRKSRTRTAWDELGMFSPRVSKRISGNRVKPDPLQSESWPLVGNLVILQLFYIFTRFLLLGTVQFGVSKCIWVSCPHQFVLKCVEHVEGD